jgi:AraC-like DNA-binding protein
MAILGNPMYILVVPNAAPMPKVVFEAGQECPLGRVVLSGLLRNHTGMPERPMRILGSYAIVYLLKGNGALKNERGSTTQLKPGDAWLVFPEIAHWYGPARNSSWDEFYIVFAGAIFDLWRERGLISPSKSIWRLEPLDYWLGRLQEVAFGPPDSLHQVCSLQLLVAEILQVSNASQTPHWLAQARRLLETEEKNPKTVAKSLGMSYETFRKQFTLAAGVAPGRYQNRKMMEMACSLMLPGVLTNKEIAEKLKFCDEFHFSRRFKQITGLTPTQFRLKLPQRKETGGASEHPSD